MGVRNVIPSMQMEDQIRRFADAGWDPVDGRMNEKLSEKAEANESAVHDLDLAYARAFGTADGQRVLEDLMTQTLFAPTFDAALGFHNGAARGFQRAGMNSLVQKICQHIERAKNLGSGKRS